MQGETLVAERSSLMDMNGPDPSGNPEKSPAELGERSEQYFSLGYHERENAEGGPALPTKLNGTGEKNQFYQNGYKCSAFTDVLSSEVFRWPYP